MLWNVNRKSILILLNGTTFSDLTLDQDFKVAIFFDIEYLRKDTEP